MAAVGRARREFFPRINPLQRYNEKKFRRRYRLTKQLVRELARDFGTSRFATKGSRKAGGLSHEEHFCLALRYYASGSLYTTIGDSQGVDASTVCRAVHAVTRYLFTVKGRYIKWPRGLDRARVARRFFAKMRFPRVLGCVDGTLIPIRSPSHDDISYLCRKQYHALNVMAVCRPDLQFSYVVSNMPGSSHDQFVFEESPLGKVAMDEGFEQFVLLGDSGYGLRDYILTPIANASTAPEERYNQSLTSTRTTIERAFGVLKQRFRVLDRSSGYQMTTPEKASLVTLACCVLHNVAIQHDLDLDVDEALLRAIIARDETHGEDRVQDRRGRPYQAGLARRGEFIGRYFS